MEDELIIPPFFIVKGLGLIPGVVGKFDSSKGFRVPHIGWNALQATKDSNILDDIGNHHVYFVHSYRAMPVSFLFIYFFYVIHCHIVLSCFLALCYVLYSRFRPQFFVEFFILLIQSEDNREWISSICNYGDNFIASVNRGNVHAVQFHPEKSGGRN